MHRIERSNGSAPRALLHAADPVHLNPVHTSEELFHLSVAEGPKNGEAVTQKMKPGRSAADVV